MDTYTTPKQSLWNSVILGFTLLFTMIAPSHGQSPSSINRSVYVEGMQNFTLLTNAASGLSANKTISLNGEWKIDAPSSYAIPGSIINLNWTNSTGDTRINETAYYNGAGAITSRSVSVQTKSKPTNSWYEANQTVLTKTNANASTAFQSPTGWAWGSGVVVLGGTSNVTFSNVFMGQTTPTERKQVRDLAVNLSYTNARWSPQ